MIEPDDLVVKPLERSDTIPSSWYVNDDFDRLDRIAVLARSWQFVGPLARVSGSTNYMSAIVAGNPVVVVRDAETRLRAFYNVCRHRGGPLVTDDCGSARMLQCKYHGWTYRLDGMLRGVPRFDRTELFDRKDYGLIPVDVAVWGGLVFVRLDSRGGQPVDTLFGGIADAIRPIELSALRFRNRVSYPVACNWKVYVDNYLEGYHIPLVHPELCDLLDYRNYRTETFDYHSLQHSPLRSGNGESAYYYYVYPNFMLNILPGRLQTNVVVPDGPRRCVVHFDYFYDSSVLESDAERIGHDQEFAERVQREDVEICEHVQRGLESRGYDRGRFSVEVENGVHHFQSLLKRDYAIALESISRGDAETTGADGIRPNGA